jgi:carbonic anhydrase
MVIVRASLAANPPASHTGIALDGHASQLKQFHFHSPSENHVAGREYPLEAHLVHADGDGNLAVIAVTLEEGADNEALARGPGKTCRANRTPTMSC